MLETLRRYWWAIALRGAAAILFGLLTIMWPGMTLAVLVLFFGVYALVDGVLAIFAAWRGASSDRWWHIVEGVLGILIGVTTWLWPGLTALTLLYLVAAWAIATGVAEVAAGVRLRSALRNEWALLLSGVLSMAFGVLLVVRPGAGALALVLIIGMYALIFGTMLVVLGFRLRGTGDAGLATS